MPQHHRSVAFSGKKKREQMRAKKERKQLVSSGMAAQHRPYEEPVDVCNVMEKEEGDLVELAEVETINARSNTAKNSNRYNLKFSKEKEEEVAARKAQHHQPVKLAPQHVKEITVEEFYPPGLDYPKRPTWNKNMSRQELDRSENRHFRLFCDKIDKEFKNGDMSLYELNLETWRQLWRVTEMSDILLVIVDARYPAAHFPPYLYHHLVKMANKGVILVLNKCDLIEPTAVLAWTDYFSTYFPHLIVVPFSSLEGCRHRKGLLRMATESSLRLVEACQRLVDHEVDLTPWRQKIERERDEETLSSDEGDEERHQNVTKMKSINTAPAAYKRCQGGILTLGTIGHPNAGKSSLINALMGKKVVSVSKTPGHTKHFQTIFLTETVKLCDCPGLVFPSRVARPLQVVLGSYPVAQVRDPIGVVAYIAGHVDIPSILKLQHSEENEQQSVWTPYTICQAWAQKRGYHVRTKGGRPDVYRAANELLRMCLVGHRSLILSFVPPKYLMNKENYEKDERLEDIRRVQGILANREEEKDFQTLSAGDRKDQGKEEENNDDDYDDDDDGDSEDVSREIDDDLRSEEDYGDDEDSEDDFESKVVHSRGKFALLMEED